MQSRSVRNTLHASANIDLLDRSCFLPLPPSLCSCDATARFRMLKVCSSSRAAVRGVAAEPPCCSNCCSCCCFVPVAAAVPATGAFTSRCTATLPLAGMTTSATRSAPRTLSVEYAHEVLSLSLSLPTDNTPWASPLGRGGPDGPGGQGGPNACNPLLPPAVCCGAPPCSCPCRCNPDPL